MFDLENYLDSNKFINLDLGCGENKQNGFVGIDKRPLNNVDIVHDLETFPYPLPDGICNTIIGSHIVEHINPKVMIDFMNELWRLLKVGGRLAFVLPYGVNHLFVGDPTHINPCNEFTWQYFDPNYQLYNIYKPKPFKIIDLYWQVDGLMEVLLEKIEEVKND